MKVSNKGFTPITPEEAKAKAESILIKTFGENVNLALDSTNGYLVQELANAFLERDDDLAMLYNQMDPDKSQGVFLESIGALSSLIKYSATYTQVVCQLSGLKGVTIPKDSKALSDNGDVFVLSKSVILNDQGVGQGVFVAEKSGAIPAPAKYINRIFQQITGWDSISNATPGIEGVDVESDYSYRSRRLDGIAKNASGSTDAIIAALSELSGVYNYAVIDNPLDTKITKFGVVVNPGSIYVSVYAPDILDDDIAYIMNSKRYCYMQGNYSYDYKDKKYPWITYPTIWQKPSIIQLLINVSIPDNKYYPLDIDQQIIKSLVDNFYGQQFPIPRYKMTEPVNKARFFYSLNLLGIYSAEIQIGIEVDSMGDEVNLPISQVLELLPENIVINKD